MAPLPPFCVSLILDVGLLRVGGLFKRWGWCWVGLATWLALAGLWLRPATRVNAAGTSAGAIPLALPNEACAACHKEIYERYRSTPMARASGVAADGFLAADFQHEASGVSYRIRKEGPRVVLSFARGGAGGGDGDRGLKGERELKYFLGSGTRGRTYLFEQDGYWFEAPINWYAKKRVWDMAPGYLKAAEMPLTLPVDPGCLHCHASGAASSLAAARNKYVGAPFEQGGITCTACHDAGGGEAERHVTSGGKVAMAKIDSLAPVKRDSVCLNCHLEGEAVVVHQGKRLEDFRPGESVFDFASYFVRSEPGVREKAGGGARAVSQWEALLESGCRRGAGAKLTCTSCHDPHASTVGLSERERVEFYRAKCLACHDGGSDLAKTGAAGIVPPHPDRDGTAIRMGHPVSQSGKEIAGGFGASHHPENRDCAGCHMPRATSQDIAHEQVTDHRIPKLGLPEAKGLSLKAGSSGTGSGDERKLVPIASGASEGSVVGGGDIRELGLAYAMSASKGDRKAGERALALLKEAELAERGGGDGSKDYELHARIGFLEQLNGDAAGAEVEYGRALQADPEDAFAAGNLALLKAGRREYGPAVELWGRAFEEDPVQLKAGMNLAIVECGLGRREAALGTLDRILSFSPDDGSAKGLASEIRGGHRSCEKR